MYKGKVLFTVLTLLANTNTIVQLLWTCIKITLFFKNVNN